MGSLANGSGKGRGTARAVDRQLRFLPDSEGNSSEAFRARWIWAVRPHLLKPPTLWKCQFRLTGTLTQSLGRYLDRAGRCFPFSSSCQLQVLSRLPFRLFWLRHLIFGLNSRLSCNIHPSRGEYIGSRVISIERCVVFASVPVIVFATAIILASVSVGSLFLVRQVRFRRHMNRLRTMPLERGRD